MTYEYIIRTCFYFSRICPLLPDIQCLKIIILCILSSFLVVSSRKVYLILVTFFWQFWNCFFLLFISCVLERTLGIIIIIIIFFFWTGRLLMSRWLRECLPSAPNSYLLFLMVAEKTDNVLLRKGCCENARTCLLLL